MLAAAGQLRHHMRVDSGHIGYRLNVLSIPLTTPEEILEGKKK